jgi:hypothetical protein
VATKPITLSALAFILLAAVTSPVLAHEGEHGHDATAHTLQLNNGQKWATDESLRQGMSRIQEAFSAEFPNIFSGKMTAQGYAALGQKIQAEIALIVQNCKLDKQADAMLHLVLAELIEGADAMSGKLPAMKPREGAQQVAQELEHYAEYFDHPGW